MRGRAFLDVARELVQKATEPHWRTAATDAYYALMLECRDALARWGFPLPPHQNVHSYVRLRLMYAKNRTLKSIADALDKLSRLRNKACYDLQSPRFASAIEAEDAIQRAADSLADLDGIDTDATQRAAAIASFQP